MRRQLLAIRSILCWFHTFLSREGQELDFDCERLILVFCCEISNFHLPHPDFSSLSNIFVKSKFWFCFCSFVYAHAQAMNEYHGGEMSTEICGRKFKCPASVAPW